jgi:hypothetical protein
LVSFSHSSLAVLVPGAHHNESLNGDAWREIDGWLATALRVPRR